MKMMNSQKLLDSRMLKTKKKLDRTGTSNPSMDDSLDNLDIYKAEYTDPLSIK